MYFSVTIKGFLHCTVYFSVTFKKSNQKKVKQTTFRYKYDHLRSLVRHLFFYFFLASLDVSINAICAVSYAWKAIWLADACVASRKVEHVSTPAASSAWNATQRNPTEPQFSSAKDDVTPFKVNLDGSTHSNAKLWMLCKGASMFLQQRLRLFTLLCRCTRFNSWFLKGCSCCKAIHRQNNRWSNVFCQRRPREWRLCVWKSLVCLFIRSCCPHTQWMMATRSLGLYKCSYLLTSFNWTRPARPSSTNI